MLQRLKVPNTLQWVIKLFILYMVVFSLFRIGTYLLFNPDKFTTTNEITKQNSLAQVIPAFLLGFIYDARWVSIILAPIVIFSFVPSFTPFKNKKTKSFWSVYLIIITLLILFFYGADFGHFQYIRTRLNASALNFIEDSRISIVMLWESYPILWIFLVIAVLVIFFTYLINRSYFKVEENNLSKSKFDYHRHWYIITLLLMVIAINASISFKPLHTSDSFRKMDNEFKGFLALNPFQNFFSSLKFRNPSFVGNKVDETKRAKYFPLIANILKLPESNFKDTTYKRFVQNNAPKNSPNVILVMCESLSSYKTSLSGNALNPTPYLNEVAQNSLYFSKCFSPTFGTARGLFAWLTGVPDVQFSKFSSRNENAINQKTIINDFKNYQKYYFIGGSPDFNNFNGLIKNIDGVNLFDETSFKDKKLNVWGISDKDLFTESNNVLKTTNQPFFAVIQTADNHEPYTIPKNDNGFVVKNLSKESLKQNGFATNEEFNAMRYFDYSVQNFLETAKKESYFNNTIFVFFGDHGVIGNAHNLYPKTWTEQRLNEEHIPLLFYAPNLISKSVRNEVVSQIDILPTVAGLAQLSYTNTTLGRDLLNTEKKENIAFTIFHDAGKIGIVSDSFYFIHNYNSDDNDVYSILNNEKLSKEIIADKVKKYLPLSEGYYETSKWLLIHNKRN